MADKIKMLLAALILSAGVVGYYYLVDLHVAARVGMIVGMTIVAMVVVLQTVKGRNVWAFVQDARTEVRKVVWPTRQETVQMTITVMVMVTVMALILWGFDSFLAWLVKALLR